MRNANDKRAREHLKKYSKNRQSEYFENVKHRDDKAYKEFKRVPNYGKGSL
jgi:type III secretory pathway component EscR